MTSALPRFLHASARNKWLFYAGVSLSALLLSYWPDGLPHLRYDRDALAAGEIWRILSGHLAHLNGVHLLLNLLGLFLLCELLLDDLPAGHAWALSVVSAVGASGFLWCWHPEVRWYAGLSGVLHGLWAGAALAACCRRRLLGGLACGLLLIKLMTEWLNGPSVHVVNMIGAPVVAPAHFYGALMGVLYLLIWKLAEPVLRKR